MIKSLYLLFQQLTLLEQYYDGIGDTDLANVYHTAWWALWARYFS